MNRIKKIIRNILIIILLTFLTLNQLGLSFTPLSAHEKSERGIHYGPSEVIHSEEFEGGKYYLCKYDKWVSCNTVIRALLIFWGGGSQPIGIENDKSKAVCYTWHYSDQYFKAYGVINDQSIKKIEITLSNGEVLTQTKFYEDLFLVTYKSKESKGMLFKAIKAYDLEDNVVFEEEY